MGRQERATTGAVRRLIAACAIVAGCTVPEPTSRPVAPPHRQRAAGPDRAPVPPPVDSERAAVRTHRVGPRETLYSLAEKYYGDPKQYRRIYYANRNRIADPRNIPVGMVLIIPPLPQ